MSVAKVIEITAESAESFDAAIGEGIARASEHVQDIQEAWIKGQKIIIRHGRIAAYRVDMKVTFIVHEHKT
ncbi:MAG: dodecin domain-containing protein [Planctomycetes bacterium]|nr:dodecin domain-containing protein [Planctomycetota bacterium]